MTSKIGSLIVSLQTTELSAEEREMLAHPLIGGVVLFSRNYDSREQVTALCQAVRSARKTPLLIMVDQEGGRVQRFLAEFTRLPNMSAFGDIYSKDVVAARRLAKECAWLMAVEVMTVGVDLSLAPVLDLNKQINSAINGRAFHANPAIVIDLATAFMEGMREAGMAQTGKHFPGHGSVTMDSHLGTPIDNRPLAVIQQEDLVPFAAFIQSGITAIMAAHIIFPQVDHRCVGFSPVWLQTILRKQLGFKGVIVSDDLNMEGANISTNYADRVAASREAGCDVVLLCNNPAGVVQVLDQLPHQAHMLEEDKWRTLQAKRIDIKPVLKENQRWCAASEKLGELVN